MQSYCFSLRQAYEQNVHYPRNEFLFYGRYEEEWWKAEDEGLPCTAQQRQSVLGPALSPLQDEFISNCSHLADSGVVSCPLIMNHYYCMPNKYRAYMSTNLVVY